MGDAYGSSRNGGPEFGFSADRVTADSKYVDSLGDRVGTTYYKFDNNQADDGGETWGANNVSNVHPSGVDIWSCGWDGVDEVTAQHPTKDNVRTIDLGDTIANWN